MKHLKFKYIIFAVVATLLISQAAFAKKLYKERAYKVTITNITKGQIFSPPVVVSHSTRFKLFELGAPADDSLVALAEDGMTAPLIDAVSGLESVYDFSTSDGPVLPGQSVTVEVMVFGKHQFITIAGMLVTTNDAFFALNGLRTSFYKTSSGLARAYDAGSEFNSESCTDIPGPPCGNGGVRNTDGAEGYVYIHSGIQGSADLDPADTNWQNPVAKIVVTPLR